MFAPGSPPAQTPAGPAPTGAAAGTRRGCSAGAMLRLGLLAVLLMVSFPGWVSAQALGTMQVTARVLSGGPGWAGLAEAQVLAREALLSPAAGSDIRRAGLVQARAELATIGGRRRLLVTVDYPRN
jgi:hypothetical protein